MNEGDPIEQSNRIDRPAVVESPEEYRNLAIRLYTNANQLRDRYAKTGAMKDIEEAIESAQGAVAKTPSHDPYLAVFLNILGLALQDRYGRTRVIEDLQEAIKTARLAIAKGPVESLDLAMLLHNLGLGLQLRYNENGALEDLEEAIETARDAVIRTPDGNLNLATYLNSLAIGLRYRYKRTGVVDDLEDALRTARKAVIKTPEGHAYTAMHLQSLVATLGDRYDRTGALKDLEEAIKTSRIAISKIQAGDPSLPMHLNSLGISLRYRYKRTRATEDLDDAIRIARLAVVKTPDNHPTLPILLNNLGNALEDQYMRGGALEYLEEAIKMVQNAVERTPDNHPDLYLYLHNLGNCLGDRYTETGAIEDLTGAIKHSQHALAKTPAKHPNLAKQSHQLSVRLGQRYRKTGVLHDLDDAIRTAEKSVGMTPSDQPILALHLNNLSSQLGERYKRSRALKHLEAAITASRRAVTEAAKGNEHLAKCLNTLGNHLSSRYKNLKVPGDLEEATRCAREAVANTRDDHRTLPTYLNDLSNQLRDQFQMTKAAGDLEEAIETARKAVAKTPAEHPNLATHSRNLGLGLGTRYMKTREIEDVKEAVLSLRKSLGSLVAPPIERIQAGKAAALFLMLQKDPRGAAEILRETLDLFPKVTLRSNSRDDLQYALQSLSGLASLTASVFFEAGRPSIQAVQALEEGRGIIASLSINSKSDESQLKEMHPNLWSRYIRLRGELADQMLSDTGEHINSTSPEAAATSQRATISRRYEISRGLEEVEKEIREQPGLERFHQPPTEKEILRMASFGPLVYLNASEISCEAFIITTTEVMRVRFKSLQLEKIRAWIKSVTSRGNTNRRNAINIDEDDAPQESSNSSMVKDVKSLWDDIVRPVLDKLGLLDQKELEAQKQRPHLWWVGGGLMGLLPLHAAGTHLLESTENTFSHVVSSYIPTLKALAQSRNKIWQPFNDKAPRVLIVSMPTTPNYSNLKVREEVRIIEEQFGSTGSVTTLEHPSKLEVLHELGSYDIAHFACHGQVDEVDPAKSALLLRGNDGTLDKLTVHDLDSIINDSAHIAYLSACSTAETKVLNLIDESIHLASTFQLVGFQHVIGTLWDADDNAAVAIAASFYRNLLQDGQSGNLSVATALHNAILWFWNTEGNEVDLSKWAPFIHIGS